MGFLVGNSAALESLVNEVYTRGLSTRDVEDAFKDATEELLTSKSALARSPTGCGRTTEPSSTGTSEVEVQYLFVDAVFAWLRGMARKEALLVGWAIAADGRKHVMHLTRGLRSSGSP